MPLKTPHFHGYLKRILFYTIFLVFCIQVLTITYFANSAKIAYADCFKGDITTRELCYAPQVWIPGLDLKNETNPTTGVKYVVIDKDTVAKYVASLYKYSVAIVGILATVMIVIGGVIWLTSAGNTTQVTTAKSYITGAVTGLVLMFCSVTLLWLINPDFVNLKKLNIEKIEKKDAICCKYKINKDQTTYFKVQLSPDVLAGVGGDTKRICQQQAADLVDNSFCGGTNLSSLNDQLAADCQKDENIDNCKENIKHCTNSYSTATNPLDWNDPKSCGGCYCPAIYKEIMCWYCCTWDKQNNRCTELGATGG